jgi:hypothetical protein
MSSILLIVLCIVTPYSLVGCIPAFQGKTAASSFIVDVEMSATYSPKAMPSYKTMQATVWTPTSMKI